jgi:hypothetical protein
MISQASLLAAIPTALRDALLVEYAGIVQGYREGRWKSAGLDAGRFCEVAYTILDGATSGTFAAGPSKPKNFPQACASLESRTPVASGDRSLRILLPRALVPIYEVRNNRNVGHVGGDVSSNKMDAEYVLAACTFVLAELVRVFHNVSTTTAQSSVDALVERRSALIWEFEGGKRVLDPGMTAADQTLLLLYSEPGWVAVRELVKWTKYSNLTVYRKQVLKKLDKALLVEFDDTFDRVQITPLGVGDVVKRLLA